MVVAGPERHLRTVGQLANDVVERMGRYRDRAWGW